MSRRVERVTEAVRQIVSSAILFELKDPRVTGVTVIRADVTGDLRRAKIYVSLMGDEKTQRLALSGLVHARGFLQKKLADQLQTRYTPVLTFVVDDSVKESLEMSRILGEVLPKPPDVPEPAPEEERSADDDDGN